MKRPGKRWSYQYKIDGISDLPPEARAILRRRGRDIAAAPNAICDNGPLSSIHAAEHVLAQYYADWLAQNYPGQHFEVHGTAYEDGTVSIDIYEK